MSPSGSDVEQQLISTGESPAVAATPQAAVLQQEKEQEETQVPAREVLGPYILDRLCGRVECPRPAARGEKFVPPVGPWSQLPEWCHVGKWSHAATATFVLMLTLLCITAPIFLGGAQRELMAATVSKLSANDVNWTSVVLRAVGGSYGLLLLVGMLKTVGWWPIITYTMISWTLLSLRLLFAAAAPFSVVAAWVAELTRYIALLQTTVVVVVWWLAIVPGLVLIEKSPAKRKAFWQWNWSFSLINVHCLNLPVAAVDFLTSPRALMGMDLWIVAAFTLAYVLFYTLVLDRRGIFLYFMFTPRTHWCCLIYIAALVLMGGMLWAWVGISGCGFSL